MLPVIYSMSVSLDGFIAGPGETGDVIVDLGPQRLGQHPTGARADNLIDQRRRHRRHRRQVITVGGIRNYCEHGTYLPDQRCRAGLAWNLHSLTREGTARSRADPQISSIARDIRSSLNRG
jgi:hypothetical protein